jgi:putative FmdB family regulatory protein
MPIYEYKCQKCNEQFEAYKPISASDETVKCPKCGADNPKRQISVFVPKNGGESCSPIRYS